MKNKWWIGMLAFLAVLGPGIITSNVDNDAGGITTYSLAGANFGYTLLWSLIPITLVLIIVQEMCARMGVVTGKGLADLIRENYGVKITFLMMTALFFVNLGNTISEFAGIAASCEIFGVSKFLSVPLCAMAVWLLVVKGTYKSVEKVFLVACVFYITYIFSGFLAKPDWAEVIPQTFKPAFQFRSFAYLTMLMGLVGTTIAPWMQFYLQASVVEKGVSLENYKYSRADVVVGSFVVNFVAFFIIVACAATIFKAGIHVETAKDAAMALAPLAGKYCASLFAFGLLNASLFAASILPLSTAYFICEAFGWESGVNKKFREAPHFYSIYTGTIVFSAGLVLLPKFPLIKAMYISQVINGILLPFVLIFMLLLINKRELMGGYINSRFFNIVSWVTVLALLGLSVGMLVTL
ncbi:Mn transporter [Candidatus Desantisbacteria bacterium CG_4_10_14_0_8_um_filter_48_22]|uniref:Mn transporter n=1 Tax=Candidatus Desantisbacteria bacterium CG_4_10_14_0_8_um_filter_48_22 TaxID=1974543 RepID=A0A2M7SF96_9BACT|nr:MAG: Mn transporter [Candidatus Desantisbacteria bacterium CG1_02_49_89]PIV57282.1 MAG: Mn transporter [Candidatus Desantisbacteria bacterium CG02_land_8_20_14_3_00_49_13]PIZ18215.1 MAG: Mn transporter [Candidatus Desantisbacteria bacterium CG_4_10_14_0_8_um_filter_48_22]